MAIMLEKSEAAGVPGVAESGSAQERVKHPLPYNENFDTTSSRTAATPELLPFLNSRAPKKK
jgi:hypothetical protein